MGKGRREVFPFSEQSWWAWIGPNPKGSDLIATSSFPQCGTTSSEQARGAAPGQERQQGWKPLPSAQSQPDLRREHKSHLEPEKGSSNTVPP